jgi:hypothetical protein
MRIEDVVDLNEENVRRFLKYCKARPEDPADDALLAFCYVDEDGKIEPKTRTNLSKSRYKEQENRILSMLGQLKQVHENNKYFSPESSIMDFIDFQTKYDGTRWTTNPNYTLYLFLLGNAGNYLYAFEKGKDGIYRTNLIEAAKVIEPMESPNDPNLLNRFPKR